MKILITGVAGFIGSKLLECLILNDGIEIVGIDNLSTGKYSNVEKYRSKFDFYEMDIEEIPLIELERIDVIIHLAAMKIPRYGSSLKTIENNSIKIWNLLRYCAKNKKRFIFASTSDVYGKGPVPFREGNDIVMGSPDHRRWAYAVSKLFDEHLIYGYHEKYNMPFDIVRLFNVYGENCALDWTGGAIPQIITKALKNKHIEIHGDGEQTRCYCYIDDIVDGFIKLIKHEFINGIINIGNDKPISVKELTHKILDTVNVTDRSKIKYIPYAEFHGKYEDVRIRVPDLSKAKELLGYVPKISIDEGLKRTIEWQKGVLND